MNTMLLIATLLSGTQCAVFLDTSSIEYLGDIDLQVNEYQTQNVGVLCQ